MLTTRSIATNSNIHVQPNNALAGGITEIVVANSSVDLQQLVYPMLAHLSQQCNDKWFTWISNNASSEKQSLSKFHFAKDKVRLIASKSKQEALWLTWDALARGNSETVVAMISELSEAERQQLEEAAYLGKTQGIVLIERS